ncbi:hypothetical protein TSAR_004415 [Trichomalopsis sarcophagae]|uniref:Uncharacterized protein n=1 Tax=Trichomalopsis sarcophagae TaxID=543379 RepID=A0A232EMR5_9HYME|nr:hypothetical protein TSAR_004415 [Trichomalopsis sarcophagae]
MIPEIERQVQEERKIEREREKAEKNGAHGDQITPKAKKPSTPKRHTSQSGHANPRRGFQMETHRSTANPNPPTTQNIESAGTDSVTSSSGIKPTGASPKTTARWSNHSPDPIAHYFSNKKERLKTTYADKMLKNGDWLPRSYEQFLRRNDLRGHDI